MRITSIFCLVMLLGVFSNAQESIAQWAGEHTVSKAFDLYDQKVYPAAYDAFEEILLQNVSVQEIDHLLLTKVKLYKALAAIKIGDQGSHYELLNFIESEKATPYLNDAYIDLAKYYYDQQDYKRAIEYFADVDLETLSNELYSEITFKKAYSHFVRKDFGVTRSLLQKILHLKDQYYFPANYYYGMSQYFMEDLEEAVISFQKLESSSAYRDRVPYYISQIYFNQKRYDELIDYGNEQIARESTKNIKEIRGLLGQAYFIRKDYDKAIFHLSYYVGNTQKLRAEDFYQLGFAYYKTNQHEKAIPQFVEIANENSKMGQNANNYLADCYLKVDNKDAARAAFKRTSEMEFIPDLAAEALFNYGKLSADMGLDREALNSLKTVEPSSIYYPESQKILSHILDNTRDYAGAIRFIEGLEMQSPVIRKTYQKLTYFYAMQFLVDGREKESVEYFNKADKNQMDNEYTALTYYRLADLDHNNRLYEQSVSRLNQYFSLIKTGINLPPDADEGYANYLQAYNYLKLENYTTARKYFEKAATSFVNQQGRGKLAMDALLRAGDCYFRINAYQDAIAFYNDAIGLKARGSDYAYYQRGILQGLLGKPFEKIVSMDELIARYPKSPLADYAIYQSGETLQAIGEPREAERSFRSIVDDYKKSTLRNKSLLKLGLIAFNQGDLGTSISYYKELFNNNPDAAESQEAMISLEEIYVDNLGKPEEFFEFIETQGGFTMSSFEKDSISFRAGEIPFENGEYEKAIESYSNYLAKYPQGFNSLIAHYRRAESYSIKKSYQRALADYEYVIRQKESQFYIASLEKAAIISYNLVENYKKAFDYYSLLEEIEPDVDKKYTAQLGALRSAARINDVQAVEYMSQKILASSQLTNEDRALALFYLGRLNADKKGYDKALEQLDYVIQNSENEFAAEARYITSRIYYEQENFTKSEEVARKAIVDSKPYPYWVAKTLMVLSDVFVEKKDMLQAKASLKAIIENFNQDQVILEEAKAKLRHVIELEESLNRVDSGSENGDLQMDSSQNKGN